MVMFIVGWNDASQGPLLPLLQEYYQVDYVIISLIWIAIAVGVVAAAVSNVYLADILGFGLVSRTTTKRWTMAHPAVDSAWSIRTVHWLCPHVLGRALPSICHRIHLRGTRYRMAGTSSCFPP
jgi:hypothetical protein